MTEYESFGATDDVHMLDALAYGPQVWTPGVAQRTIDANKEAEETILSERCLTTGY